MNGRSRVISLSVIRMAPARARAVSASLLPASIALFFLSTFALRAANESYYSAPISGQAIVAAATVQVEDGKFLLMPSNDFLVKQAIGYVTLRIDEAAALAHKGIFSVRVELEITYREKSPSHPLSTTTATLEISYDKASPKTSPHQDRQTFRIVGAHSITARVVTVTAGDGSGTIPVPGDVILDANVDVERYYTFDHYTSPTLLSVTTVKVPAANNNGTVEIAWAPQAGAEEYDLEWTVVGAEGSNGVIVPGSQLSYDFRHNASRITTTETNYSLNLVFEKAWVVIRIRGVGRSGANPDQRIEGGWSLGKRNGIVSDASSTGHVFATEFHEPSMNWRYIATYAEEGKVKEVVEYYDGTLRQRQAVTLLSTTDITVVAESIPDYAGRAAIQTLPAPTAESIFHFYRTFSLGATSGKPYNAADFDLIPGQCSRPADAFDNASGGGNYYSDANPDQSGMNAFIPDAGGYPFVQTSFTPDNTGRVRSQSGAGEHHAIGSGHETQYYYGTPFQEDLDRLFGADVGYNIHYKKNLVVDPNGQVSVAYLDPAGRTIATALAGNNPASLERLPSNTGGTDTTVDLMGTNTIEGYRSTALNTHLPDSKNVPHAFTYSLDRQSVADTCTPNECFDCAYDLTISVRDQCGREMIPGGPIADSIGFPLDSTCATSTGVNYTFNTMLDIGSYAVVKTLRLNESAIEFYLDRYIAGNTCVKTYEEFLAEELERIDFSGCGGDYCDVQWAKANEVSPGPSGNVSITVGSDLTVMGAADAANLSPTPVAPITNTSSSAGKQEIAGGPGGLMANLPADCIADCEEHDPCEAGYNMLVADMRTDGQYAAYFSDENYWRHPSPPYRNEDGTSARILNSKGESVPPEDPTITFEEFRANRQGSWAESLVRFHPEYCYYKWCWENRQSNRFDARMVNTETCAGATASGFLPDPLTNDPFFRQMPPGKGSSRRAEMEGSMTSFGGTPYTMKEMAIISVHCLQCDQQDSARIARCLKEHPFGTDSVMCDEEWSAFRDLYLARKQALVDAQREDDVKAKIPCGPVHVSGSNTARYQSALQMLGITNPPDSAKLVNSARDSLNAVCAGLCEGYADRWLETLEGCASIYTDWKKNREEIRADLIDVCRNGCDECSFLGATTTAPNKPTAEGDRSFDDVLHRWFGSRWNLYPNDVCDVNLITTPMPYGHNYEGTPPDPLNCGCPSGGAGSECLTCDTVLSAVNRFVENNLMPPSGSGNCFERLTADLNRRFSFNMTWNEYSDFLTSCGDSATIVRCEELTETAYLLQDFLNAALQHNKGLISKNGFKLDYVPFFHMLATNSGLGDSGCNSATYRTCFDTVHPFLCDRRHLRITIAGTGTGCHCDIDLELPDSGRGFNEIIDLTDIRPNPADVDSTGRCHGFIFTARTSKGSGTMEMRGHSDCFIIAECVRRKEARPEHLRLKHPKRQFDWRSSDDGSFTTTSGNSTSITGTAVDTESIEVGMSTNSVNGGVLSDTQTDISIDAGANTNVNAAPTSDIGIGSINTAGNSTIAPESGVTTTSADANMNAGQVASPEHSVRIGTTDGGANSTTVAQPGATNTTIDANGNAGVAATSALKVQTGTAAMTTTSTTSAQSGAVNASVATNDNADIGATSGVQANVVASNAEGALAIGGQTFETDASVAFAGGGDASDLIRNPTMDSLSLDTNIRPSTYRQPITPAICRDCESILCNRSLFEPPVELGDPCRDMLVQQATASATYAYNLYIDSVKNDLRSRYVSTCMNLAGKERFEMDYTQNEYHFTLYYYDQTGNLVQTVPPAGVVPLTSAADLQMAKEHRANPAKPGPAIKHTLQTRYWYNSLNQLVRQSTPDGGVTTFKYDRLGRLVVSQSARQAPKHQYSYSRYDALGRITEVGQVETTTALHPGTVRNEAKLAAWIAGGTRTEITRTVYDAPISPTVGGWFGTSGQENLRGRVASTTYSESEPDVLSGTHYSYDIHGNVKSLVQENTEMPTGHREKRIDYSYDLVSGNVNAVDYQPGAPDAFHHRYEYDADNRILEVYTSPDSVIWDRDASYFYYLHGPLFRTEIGDAKVQGLDYAYTIQGWIKGVNSNTLRPDRDMGRDGYVPGPSTTTPNQLIARDEFGYTLGYFGDDYRAIGGSTFEATAPTGSGLADAGPELFNGNIRHIVTAIGAFMKKDAPPLGTAYDYDQLNRLVGMEAFDNLGMANNEWSGSGPLDDYRTRLTYDGNGNILTHLRNGAAAAGPIDMDSMTYRYYPSTNQLEYVDDPIAAGNYGVDIDDQTAGNYAYDSTGNLTDDDAEGLHNIEWTVSGKMKSLEKSKPAGAPGLMFVQTIAFRYDPAGNRIAKMVGGDSTVFYVRDATGNVMATYIAKGGELRLESNTIYGSGRLGEYRAERDMATPLPVDLYTRTRGARLYELSNHLGNVLTVITDRKIPDTNAANIVEYFTADVVSATDYYAFGMGMVGRTVDVEVYRFGFNGKEQDNEVHGSGNWYDYGMRPYDPRIGRPHCIDPLYKQYPELSPYQFFHNNPIRNVDIDGAEGLPNEILNAAARAVKVVVQKATNYVVAKVANMAVDYAAEKTAEKIKGKTTPAQQQAIGLTGEFFWGVGDENRSFGPNDPITKDLMKSNYTDKARRDFYEINKEAIKSGDFSKIQTIERTYKFRGVLTEGGNAQQFVGSAKITISLDKDNKTLNYSIYNETSKNSLFYNGYIPFVDATSYSRDENPAMGTTSQTYTSSEPLVTPGRK